MHVKKHLKLTAEPGKQEFTAVRDFDAPRDDVFRAFTDPALYVRWLGPRRMRMTLETFEPRSGGRWRYVHEDETGRYGFHGVFHEVRPPERLIDTFEFEGLPEPGHVSLETATFEERPGGITRLTIHSVFQSVADRDGMLGAGAMEEGLNESFDRLDEVLRGLE